MTQEERAREVYDLLVDATEVLDVIHNQTKVRLMRFGLDLLEYIIEGKKMSDGKRDKNPVDYYLGE